jgi:UDP-glucose-4-epimerase
MNVLLTGGAGYIGSHAAVSLMEAGHSVVSADNFINSSPEVYEKIEEITKKKILSYKGDVADAGFLDKVFRENKIDAVVHFAGLKAVGESVKIPLRYYRNNIDSTLTLLETMIIYGVKKLVFSSSATVYGDPARLPITEDTPLSATNPYGTTKLIIENILRDVYASDRSFHFAILRYFNPVGAHKSGLIGEKPSGIPNNLMPYIAQVAAGKLSELKVFGNDYDTPDGAGVRDYIHVVDLAEGHVAALEKIDSFGAEAINLGTGRGYSVFEMIRAFEKASGKKIPYSIAPRRPGDIAACYASPEKAKKILGWEAKRGLDEMCVDLWKFQNKEIK